MVLYSLTPGLCLKETVSNRLGVDRMLTKVFDFAPSGVDAIANLIQPAHNCYCVPAIEESYTYCDIKLNEKHTNVNLYL